MVLKVLEGVIILGESEKSKIEVELKVKKFKKVKVADKAEITGEMIKSRGDLELGNCVIWVLRVV